MRIIGGYWKRTRLTVPDRPGLRPTPDRVRETVFNWLGQDLRGLRCVDAFAGSGALGFEAASRGAAEVLLVEHDAQLARRLRQMQQQLQALQLPAGANPARISVRHGDGLAVLRQLPAGSQDVVFLDPPFVTVADVYVAILQAARAVLADAGVVYLEAGTAWDAARLVPLGLALQRQFQAGAVHAHLLCLER